MPENKPHVFLMSPARIGGLRSDLLLRDGAAFDLAIRLRTGTASIAEAYSFISGLYFRGKITYVRAFAAAPVGLHPALVMVPGLGLVPPETLVSAADLRHSGTIGVSEKNADFCEPLLRDAKRLKEQAGPQCHFVLLGSVATAKYTGPLCSVFKERVLFPTEFAGRGDMSRGGLMLRQAALGQELNYAPVETAARHGKRPPKLEARN